MSGFLQLTGAKRGAKLLATVFAASLLAACGGSGSGNSVVSKPGVSLFTNAGSAVNVAAGSSADYTIGGGGGGSSFVSYNASSSDVKVATATVSGASLKITGVNPGETSIVVTDSAGASLAIAVKVPAVTPPRVEINAPAKVALTAGMSTQYRITGGKAPYRTATSAPNVVAATVSADSIAVTAANPGTATVVVYDALGNSTNFEITVTGGNTVAIPLYTTAPETLRMSAKASTTYTVDGGTAPYAVASADPAVADATLDGKTLRIQTGNPGRAALSIRDSKGALVVVTVTVLGEYVAPLYTTAPSGVAVPAGSQAAYTISGGTGPYIASSGNTGVAQASVSEGNQLQINGISAGVSDVLVFDSNGAFVKIVATVGGGTSKVPLYTSAPTSITVLVGATPTYQVAGGTAPYIVTSSNVSVATVTQTADTFTISGNKAGKGVISIRDATGAAVNINVDVL